MSKRRILIDCDPGIDDTIAIILAACSPIIELVGITTVSGNVGVDKTTLNALKICEFAGIADTPVARGAERPLVREPITGDVHGESGIGGVELPFPTKTVIGEHAVDFIIRTLLESEGDITLVPIGPLTNIALAIRKEPSIISKIQEIVIMGGGTFGNITPAAEFNFYADAEAAAVVFASALPITMIGLDLTHQAIATETVKDQIASIDNDVSQFVLELLGFYDSNYKKMGFEGAVVHDLCCVAYCIDSSLFATRHVYVDIETKDELLYGASIVDLQGVTGKQPNANVAIHLNQEKFWSLLINTLRQYS
ncbi:nucleoside hydrolase [Paenibacillus aestuarii]|uniref:Nucleoside hydrolase n=1 Tax=Paenibacillus aestuarii TaxID=516965 RepID=A0ABW0KC88_9BACL|nr:nucleoside hydrolase [Paenibacillus aestuarii]